MATLVIVLRALHILGGVCWAGGVILMYGFVVPSVRATQPESGRFMQHFAGKSGISMFMMSASLACVLAGLALFAPISGTFDRDWMRSTRGVVLSVGALIGLLAMLEGLFVTGPNARKLGALGRELGAAGGPPSPEQAKQLAMLQNKMTSSGTRGAWMVAFAALLMAVARYV
jgi:uncharacterized membrane protein